MEHLKILLINEFSNIFLNNKNKKITTFISLILAVLFMLYFSSLYVNMFIEILPIEKYFYIPYIFSFVIFILIILLSTSVKGYLFGFKDFDLLMSLPIKKELIMTVKFSSFLILQYIYVIFLMIPMIIIYGINANMDIIFYLFAFIGLPFMPLVAILISLLIGITIKVLSGKSKYENLISGILSFGVSSFIFFLSFNMNPDNNVQIIKSFSKLISFIKIFIPTIYFYVNGAINGNIIHFILNIVINLFSLLLAIKIFSNMFIKLNNISQEGYKVKKFKFNNTNINKKGFTLFKKEFLRFLSNFQYILNMSFGLIIMVGASIYLLINKNNFIVYIAEVMSFGEIIIVYGLLIMGQLLHSTCTTCVSISLEGKQLWIIKSLPISVKEIFLSKALVNILLILFPSIFSLLIISYVLKISIVWVMIAIVYFICVSLFVSMIGLVLNILFPKLDFDREIVVIKQSMSSFLGIMINLIMGISVGFLTIKFSYLTSAYTTMLIIIMFYLTSSLIMYVWLSTEGVKKFNNL